MSFCGAVKNLNGRDLYRTLIVMNSTSESLLIRLADQQDQQAWHRFVQLYAPLIFFWARKTGLQEADARDIVQDVLGIVFKKMDSFVYEPSKSFRGWLRTITVNKHRELCRKKSDKVKNVSQSHLLEMAVEKAESTWDAEYQKSLVNEAMKVVEGEFQPNTWKAVCEFVATRSTADEVAKKFGISVWTVYSAKSRLLARLRQVLDGLLE